MKDVVIIGGGVIGASIARELSKYELDITVLEKENDLAEGVSKANSGIVHAGFNEKPETLKGKLNLLGNNMFDELSRELDFSFKRNGALVLAFNDEEMEKIKELKENGEKLGVKGLEILSKEQVLNQEKNISSKVLGALYAKSSGIVNPYEMTIALAENANMNGVEFKFNSEVVYILKMDSYYKIKLKNGEDILSKVVINAAGLNADLINNRINNKKYKIEGIKGEYVLFDKSVGGLVNKTLFRVPTNISKGVLVTKTTDGNILVGPSAIKVDDKEALNTNKKVLGEILGKGKNIITSLPLNKVITTFVGIRPHISDDFIIEEDTENKNFINVIGIESPGLTAAPAIAVYVKELLEKNIKLKKKTDFNPIRVGIKKFNNLSIEEKNELIKINPAYGIMICKCELITEGEIIDSIKRPLGARTVDGVKRRTRATMGGCQGVGCLIPIAKILKRELNCSYDEVIKGKEGSSILGYEEV